MPRRKEQVALCWCVHCGREVHVPAWLIEMASNWNYRNRKRDEITKRDVVCCDACDRTRREPEHEQQALFEKENA